MNIADRARTLYKEKVQRQSETSIADSIQAAKDLESLRDHPGWRRLVAFINTQTEGSEEMLDKELGHINLINFPRIVTGFFKYLYVVQERRAYRKIEMYIRITIQKGEQNAERQRKAEENQPSK